MCRRYFCLLPPWLLYTPILHLLFFLNGFLFIAQTKTRHTEDCSWLTPTNGDFMRCNDGSTCDIPLFSCCSERGGRAKCPLRSPLMCAQPNSCGSDYCCEPNCDPYGGIRQCGELISGDTPCILETEFNSNILLYFCLFLTGHMEIKASSAFCLLNLLTNFQSQYRHLHAPGPRRHSAGGRSSVYSNCEGFTSLVHTQKFHNPH